MQSLVNNVLLQIESVVLGKPKQVRLALACLLAKGHILIEDLPGMGKTTLAHILASSLGLSYQRVQFTSDLLPSDVVGISIFNTTSQSFEFHQGPLFNQVILADEINRASPKTQSALLEAMEERQVSIDGQTHQLAAPFFVIATQNPLFHAGTYPLPESQLDRFMMKLSLGFPDRQAEKQILLSPDQRDKFHPSDDNLTIEQLTSMQIAVEQVTVKESVLDYIISLCQVTREANSQVNPLSPRAAKALLAAAKAWAFIDNRDYVLPDDIQAVFTAVCEHRMVNSDINVNADVCQKILQQVDVLAFN
ncbi:AAA family ATPase [Thalassotalea agariperforans]